MVVFKSEFFIRLRKLFKEKSFRMIPKSEWTKILLEETTALIMQSNSSVAEQLQKDLSCM